jgi:DNA-binding transcriptional ArsR family regulator
LKSETKLTEDIDKIRKELDEVRAMKERLRSEIDDIKREKREIQERRKELVREERVLRRARRKQKLPRPHRLPRDIPEPPEPSPPPRIELDLEDMTDSLEEMMEGLGEQIEDSLKGIRGIEASIRLPGVYMRHGKTKKRKKDREIENISAERVAEVISPLGSVERLKILDFLKTDAATFNEIEQHIGKTGSSLTHHLNPLIDAGYVIKGEVRGTYYATIQGILAYRLAKWLTSRVERERIKAARKRKTEPKVIMDFEEDDEEEEENGDEPQ